MLLRAALILATLLGLQGCYITDQAKFYDRAVERAPYDAVIVPGIPYEGGAWSDLMKIRVHWAVDLYRKGLTRNIVFSGSAVYTPYREGTVMALYAEQLGVPREHILVEPMAEHSTENLFLGYRKALAHGHRRVALATDPFQAGMLRGLIARMRREVRAELDLLPIVFKQLGGIDMVTPSIDPSSAYVTDFVPLPERQGFFKRFKGTRGGYLEWDRLRAEAGLDEPVGDLLGR